MEIKKKRVTYKELVEGGLIPWKCWRTTKRKIQNENFPAYYDGQWFFDPKEVDMWWKKRKLEKKTA